MSRRRLVSIGLIVIVFAATIVAVRSIFTTRNPGANDLYPRWRGSQLYWTEGVDPYSQAASEAIQTEIYGRLAQSGEDQLLFVYPFYTAIFLAPLAPVPYDWVQAIWLVITMFAIIAGVLLILRLLDWQAKLWLLAIIMLWAVIFYNSTRTIILGQFAGLVFLFTVGSLLALKQRRLLLAGVFLALTTIKPQMSYLFIAAMLLWGLARRQWVFIASFGISMLLLVGASFILLPSWLSSFVEQVQYYPDYTVTGSPLWVITGYYWPQLGKPVEYVMAAALLLFMLLQWRILPKAAEDSIELLYIISITLIVTNMITVRTATTNYITMYLPLFLLLKELSSRVRWGDRWIAVILALSVFASWALFLLTISGDFEHPVNYLPLPFVLLVPLIYYRRLWFEEPKSA